MHSKREKQESELDAKTNKRKQTLCHTHTWIPSHASQSKHDFPVSLQVVISASLSFSLSP